MKKCALLFAIFLVAFSGQAQNQDSIAITKLIGNFIDAFNQKDLKLFTNLFAEDADFYNWQGALTKGRQKIEDFHAGVFKRLSNTKLQLLSSSIRFVKPDVAVVIVNEENTNMTSADGKPLPNRLVNLIWVVTKENSTWLIKVNHTAMLNEASKGNSKN